MSYYTVRRDDPEIRVVICPKCSTPEHGIANVTKLNEVIPYKNDEYLLRLMKCNECGCYFTFYREDGLKEITEKEAIIGLEKGHCDMRVNGEDVHGHSFYIVFKNKPPTISGERYAELMGFKEDKDGNYNNGDEKFARWKKRIPSINQLVRYRKLVENIDFEGMKYLDDYKNEGF